MSKNHPKHPVDEMADKAKQAPGASGLGSQRQQTYEHQPAMARLREAVEGDYYQINYLKQPEEHAAWLLVTELWPTREEAETKAEALREGRHASITIKPKRWE